jgi:hypothetical protein
LKERDHFEDKRIDTRAIIKWILNELMARINLAQWHTITITVINFRVP